MGAVVLQQLGNQSLRNTAQILCALRLCQRSPALLIQRARKLSWTSHTQQPILLATAQCFFTPNFSREAEEPSWSRPKGRLVQHFVLTVVHMIPLGSLQAKSACSSTLPNSYSEVQKCSTFVFVFLRSTALIFSWETKNPAPFYISHVFSEIHIIIKIQKI